MVCQTALTRSRGSRSFTLIELLVVVAIIALLIAILLPALNSAKEQARIAKCAAHFRQIGTGVQNCFNEYNGYGPAWDDGHCPRRKSDFMLTWVDVLYDIDAIGDWRVGICPTDKRPDDVTGRRGEDWEFKFVERMGVGEQPKPGVRTSYALNIHMHYNFKADRFEQDPTRQVYAMDGWWSWCGCVNAAWLMAGRLLGYHTDPLQFYGNWEATNVGWRHSHDFSANALFLDGHVDLVTPRAPSGLARIRQETFDTMRAFTWLPHECPFRFGGDIYRQNWTGQDGYVRDWAKRRPVGAPQPPGGPPGSRNIWAEHPSYNPQWVPLNYPDELHPAYRTQERLWRKLPNESQDRD